MDDSFGVRCIECVRNLDSPVQHLLTREGPAGNAVFQRGAFYEFHRNERLAVVFSDFMDGANIWMVQGGSGLRLPFETAQSLGVWREAIRKEVRQVNEEGQLSVKYRLTRRSQWVDATLARSLFTGVSTAKVVRER